MSTSSIDDGVADPDTSLASIGPGKSSAEFDALIELLATDADEAIEFSTKSTRKGKAAALNLRDDDGVYDFTKIRDFFSGGAHGLPTERTPTPRARDGGEVRESVQASRLLIL